MLPDRFFVVDGAAEAVATQVRTCPGDSLADVRLKTQRTCLKHPKAAYVSDVAQERLAAVGLVVIVQADPDVTLCATAWIDDVGFCFEPIGPMELVQDMRLVEIVLGTFLEFGLKLKMQEADSEFLPMFHGQTG